MRKFAAQITHRVIHSKTSQRIRKGGAEARCFNDVLRRMLSTPPKQRQQG